SRCFSTQIATLPHCQHVPDMTGVFFAGPVIGGSMRRAAVVCLAHEKTHRSRISRPSGRDACPAVLPTCRQADEMLISRADGRSASPPGRSDGKASSGGVWKLLAPARTQRELCQRAQFAACGRKARRRHPSPDTAELHSFLKVPLRRVAAATPL